MVFNKYIVNPTTSFVTLFRGVERVLLRDPLDLGGEPRVGQDGAVRVDAVDGEPEGDLLVAVRHVEEASCDDGRVNIKP